MSDLGSMQADEVLDTLEAPLDELEAIEQLLTKPSENEAEEIDEEIAEPTQEQIDYSKEVPMPNGEKITIGELKDVWQQQAKLALDISERENGMKDQIKQLNQLAEWVGAIPEEVVNQTVYQRNLDLQNEHAKLLQIVPEWNDRNTYELGRQEIFNLAKEYDILDIVGDITDHRAIKLLNDFAKIKKSLKTAVSTIKKADIPKGKPNTQTRASTTDKLIQRAKGSNNSDLELSAINALLG